MDLRVYYQKLRQVAAEIAAKDAIMVSLETPDGGRAGVMTEAPRDVAARLIVEGRARLATEEEMQQYREEQAEARRQAEQAVAASKLQVTLLTEADLKALKGQIRGQKA